MLRKVCLILVIFFGFASFASAETEDLSSQAAVNQYVAEPEQLQAAVKKCSQEQTNEPSPQCQIVGEAANRMQKLIWSAVQNPEEFGEQILKAQMQLADLEKKRADLEDAATKSSQEVQWKKQQALLIKQIDFDRVLIKQYLGVKRILGL